MTRALTVRVLLNCVAGGAVLVTASFVATPAAVQAPTERPGPATPVTRSAQEADRVTALLMKHRCWTGAAPAASPEPGHAVVTAPGGKPRLVPAAVGFGIWLENQPGVLHGFCP